MVDAADGKKLAIVDVPPMGFAWLTAGDGMARVTGKEPRLAEDARQRDGVVWLRNEFIEAAINPGTGALQWFKVFGSRGNRLSQQLAFRFADEHVSAGGLRTQTGDDGAERYSVMAADEIYVASASSVHGEIHARGRLLRQNGELVGRFQQTWRLWRGSRVLQLNLELEPIIEPGSDPWNSYYACRFAWPDEAAELHQSVNQTRQRVTKQRMEAPLYIDLESGGNRTTILTGGLPYHRRVGERMLDSLLVVRGENTKSFRFGIGLDLSHPLPEALGIMAPPMVIHETAPSPNQASCWLFHIDARSVVATHWSVLEEEQKAVGVRVRLLESSGKSVRARMSAFVPFASARQLNFLGETQSELQIADGKVVVNLTANEWTEIEARW
jgi:alpha-mannosidase